MKPEIIRLLAKNARYTLAELASMLGTDEASVAADIRKYEQEGVLCGYRAVVDWDRFESAYVTAIIEMRVIPKFNSGYEEIATRISQFHEVEAVYLMSGVYDLHVMVKGKNLKEVASFVSHRLSRLEGVTSITTHFVLRRYKELDCPLCGEVTDDRGHNAI